ncbi:NB-ARC domain-containing protein [Leptothoe sp. LEGE 181152]|nr:NB-ARC domain-containing protein [Leptothoe sp. LEGE 181152]
MSRSLKVHSQSTQTVKSSLKRCGFRSQRSLAEDLGMALSTVSRFLNGKPVDFATFVEICDRLSLEWRTITDIADDTTSETDLEASSALPSEAALLSSDIIPPEQPPASEPTTDTPQQDWEEAIDTTFFHGRNDELAKLKNAILTDKCRLVAILGLGGIGKTSLAAKLAQTVSSDFDVVIWRSVRNAPSLKHLLKEMVPFVSQQQDMAPTTERLFHWLRSRRCLIILDNVETLLESGQSGQYRTGYEDYGDLLRRFGETTHRSCLMITSREKPSEIGVLESNQLLTRSFQLGGSAEAAQAIVEAKGLLGTPETIQQFCQRYGNNPLAIKIVGTSIQSIFDGDIDLFLRENAPVFNDFRRLLNQQFERLSPLEQSILYWLAINREWTTTSELLDDIWPVISRADVFDALESLSWRSLIEVKGGQYTQQPVIMEHVTERLIQTIYEELTILSQPENLTLATASPHLFHTHALLKTTNRDYVRDSQRRMILAPITKRLQALLIQPHMVSQYMISILTNLRQVVAGYGVGNFINLCRQLDVDLTGYDFSNLAIWQANLKEISLRETSFAQANFQNCQFNHDFGAVIALAVNPDNTLLAVGDLQGHILIWDLETYNHLETINGHPESVFSVEFSPDGKYLLSGSGDATLKLWQTTNYQCIQTFQGHHQTVMSVAFSPNGEQIVSAGVDKRIKLWDITSGRCVRTLKGHNGAIRAITFAQTKPILASASFDNTVKLWNWETGQCINTLVGHTQGVWSVDFGPDDHLLVSSSNDHSVRVWDAATGDCLKVLSGHQHAVWCVKVSPDGNNFVSGDYSGLIKLWDLKSYTCERSLQGHNSWVWSLAFSRDSTFLYSGGQDRTIRIWEYQYGCCIKTLSGYTNTVWALDFSPDGKTLASGSHDGKIRLWDITQQQCRSTLLHQSSVFNLSFSSDGNYLASVGGEQPVVKVWRLDKESCSQHLTGHTGLIRSVKFHPNSNFLCSTGSDQTCKLWNIASNENNNNYVRTFLGHKETIWSVAFSHNGRYVATGSFDCSVRLWNPETGDCLQTFIDHSDHVHSVVFSSDDRLLASTSSDTTVRIWNVQTGECLKTLTGFANAVLTGLFLLDSSRYVSGEFNGNLKIWDVESGQCQHTIQAHNHILWALALSSNGQILASGGEGDTIKLWDTQSWQCIGTLQLPGPYEGMNLTNATGLSTAEKTALYALGAVSA